MPDPTDFRALSPAALQRINQLCDAAELQWKGGEPPDLSALLAQVEPAARLTLVRELIALDAACRRMAKLPMDPSAYAALLPELTVAQVQGWLGETTLPGEPVTPVFPERALMPDVLAHLRSRSDQPPRLGEYLLLELLGGGGMGEVYRAEHQRMQRQVALKVLRGPYLSDPLHLRRFEREIRAAARLSHPHIVQAYDAGEDQGVHFLVTELVEGGDLSQRVRREGPLSWPQAARCIQQAAEGLAYAHEHGVIHRDIKPSNLLLDRQQNVKVADLGLARFERELETPAEQMLTQVTASGAMLGTALFMAPEQARNAKNADARSDIYSLGCTLHFLLTGKPLYEGDSMLDTLLAHASAPLPPLPDASAPPALQQLYQRMIAKRPEDRPQTMAEVAAELARLTAPALSRTTPSAVAASPAPRRPRPLWWLAAAVPAAVLALGAWLLRPAPPTTTSHAPTASTPATATPPGSVASFTGGLEFDGRSAYAVAPRLEHRADRPETYEAWVEIRAPRTCNILSWLGPDWVALFLTDAGQWGVGRMIGARSHLLATSGAFVANQPTHIAGVWDGQTLRLFVNGQPMPTTEIPFQLEPTRGGLHVGGAGPGALPHERFVDGVIYRLRLSKSVRYTTAFTPQTDWESDADTLALYRFNEGRGVVALDAGPGKHHLEIVGARWRAP